MTSSFAVTVPHNEDDTTNSFLIVLLRQFDYRIKLSDKAIRQTGDGDVVLMSSAFRQLYMAFNDLRPFISNESLPCIEINIRSMADALGEICYQDMAILELEEVVPQTPGEVAPTIREFIDSRKAIRWKSRQILVRALIGLRENVHRAHFVKAVTPPARQAGDFKRRKPGASLRSLADTIIESYLDQFEKSGKRLNDAPSIELLEIDRATQRLHYAIDLFSDCWISDLRIFSRSLANLQRVLGRVSHCEAWIKELRKQIAQANKTPQAAKRNFVFLFSHFSELRNNHLHESLALWNAWETDQLSNKLRKTIARPI